MANRSRAVGAFCLAAGLGLGGVGHAMTLTTDFHNLTPDRGMGSGLNKYGWSAVAPSDGYLYVGSFNVNVDYFSLPTYLGQIAAADDVLTAATDGFRRFWLGNPATASTGGEIWRTDGHVWEQVLKTGPEEVGFRGLAEYKGAIYAASANGPNGPMPDDAAYEVGTTVTYDPERDGTKIYRSFDGTTWEEVSGGPSDNVFNTSVRSLTVIDHKLYVATENAVTGAELHSFDGTSWTTEVVLNDGGMPEGIAISEVIEYKGKPTFGTWLSGDQRFQVLQLQNDGSLLDLTPKFSDPTVFDQITGVMELREYNDQLYVGTLGYLGGFALVRSSDPHNAGIDDWEVITSDGFGTEFAAQGGTSANAYPWSSVVIDGVYYLGTFQTNSESSVIDEKLGFDVPLLDGRGQIWYSHDGETWHILEDNGFDSPFTYGVRELLEWDGKLVATTASNLFLPDIFSDPYLIALAQAGDLTQGILQSWLAENHPEHASLVLAALDGKWGENGWTGDLPYIGFEVYAGKIAPIPLPATALLLLGGLAGLGMCRHRAMRLA